MLGEAFYKQFSSNYELKCTDIDVNDNWLEFLDFRNFEYYKKDVFRFNPDFLFHLGAYIDLEFCLEICIKRIYHKLFLKLSQLNNNTFYPISRGTT